MNAGIDKSFSWSAHAHQVIARKLADIHSRDLQPEVGALDLRRSSMSTAAFASDDINVVAPHVSVADLATPIADPRLGRYLPGFGKPHDNTTASRMLRRLDAISFPFTVLPE